MDIEFIKRCVRENDMHQFYGSYEWQELADKARRLQHNECQRCKEKGFYAPCEVVHHKLHVKDRPEKAMDLDNLECLCRECHEEAHSGKGAVRFTNEERW